MPIVMCSASKRGETAGSVTIVEDKFSGRVHNPSVPTNLGSTSTTERRFGSNGRSKGIEDTKVKCQQVKEIEIKHSLTSAFEL
jgi:hypothetical protein